jgi:hypothetical protein
MNRSYKEIFDALFTNEEILSLFHHSKLHMTTKPLTSWKDRLEPSKSLFPDWRPKKVLGVFG